MNGISAKAAVGRSTSLHWGGATGATTARGASGAVGGGISGGIIPKNIG